MPYSTYADGFQSTLPIREETRGRIEPSKPCGISIHSSHTGRDYPSPTRVSLVPISIHSSHTGRDPPDVKRCELAELFQSTLPIREETCYRRAIDALPPFQSTLPIREETPIFSLAVVLLRQFQSTLPIREETRKHGPAAIQPNFNPLFPYGKRRVGELEPTHWPDFNPLFPYGKRHATDAEISSRLGFQSTLPIREETGGNAGGGKGLPISIHSSHTGRDAGEGQGPDQRQHFNPLFPYGKRPLACLEIPSRRIFQSTLPIREETDQPAGREKGAANFNPLFPYGKRPVMHMAVKKSYYFNPLFPYGKRPTTAFIRSTARRFQSTLPIREETVAPSKIS